MPYDEHLAERVEKVLKEKRIRFQEKRMMGGLCIMVKDKMCMGIEKNRLMARIDPDVYEVSLKKKGVHEMNFTGKPMKGYVYVDSKAVDMDKDLEYWVQLCLDFNPKAKSSKKKAKK